MNRSVNGIWSGLIATGPMTLSFFKFFKEISKTETKPLPPSQLTAEIEDATGLKPKTQNQHANLTMASHFLYGAVTGFLYSHTAGRIKANSIIKGSVFGSSVWAASYLGWIPFLNLHPQASKMSTQRNTMMVISHLVWGISLAYAEERLHEQGSKMLSRNHL